MRNTTEIKINIFDKKLIKLELRNVLTLNLHQRSQTEISDIRETKKQGRV